VLETRMRLDSVPLETCSLSGKPTTTTSIRSLVGAFFSHRSFALCPALRTLIIRDYDPVLKGEASVSHSNVSILQIIPTAQQFLLVHGSAARPRTCD